MEQEQARPAKGVKRTKESSGVAPRHRQPTITHCIQEVPRSTAPAHARPRARSPRRSSLRSFRRTHSGQRARRRTLGHANLARARSLHGGRLSRVPEAREVAIVSTPSTIACTSLGFRAMTTPESCSNFLSGRQFVGRFVGETLRQVGTSAMAAPQRHGGGNAVQSAAGQGRGAPGPRDFVKEVESKRKRPFKDNGARRTLLP